ncbi:MAG: hypothetical protein QOE45_3119 [Frankiaceae bacterium]|jgi:hypothetical protein|nr:hypothetical protein [Frankiaceae bacterium]
MSRRAVGAFALAAALLSSGVVPLVAAHAAACAAWTDPTGDAHAQNKNGPADPQLDIVSATLGTVDGKVTAKVTLASLSATATNVGDEIGIGFVLNGKSFILFTDRDGVATSASIYNSTDDNIADATAAYDVPTKTVTLTSTVADLTTALGTAAVGKVMTGIYAYTSGQFLGVAPVDYDTARGYGLSYTVGEDCAAPAAPAVPGPLVRPTAACNTIADGKNDGTPNLGTVQGTVVGTANDPDLDITGVAFNTTPTEILLHLRIDKLAAKPATGEGHMFWGGFTANSKTVLIEAAQMSGATQAIQENGPFVSLPFVVVGGTRNDTVRATATFDVPNSTVVLGVDRASLAAAVGSPLADGLVVTATNARSLVLLPHGGGITADIAQAAVVADQVYTVGESPCFGPLPAKLANAGVKTVQYTDAAAVATKVTDSAGKPLAGRTVTFAIGSAKATGKSGSDGVARASLNPGLAAGAYDLVASFAGDATAAKAEVTTPFTVTAEKTKLVLTVAKSGSKRTVTAKLLDDDGKPVAGQKVTWYVNGAKGATATTNGAGVVTLGTAKSGQTVKAELLAVAGKYLACTAQLKV